MRLMLHCPNTNCLPLPIWSALDCLILILNWSSWTITLCCKALQEVSATNSLILRAPKNATRAAALNNITSYWSLHNVTHCSHKHPRRNGYIGVLALDTLPLSLDHPPSIFLTLKSQEKSLYPLILAQKARADIYSVWCLALILSYVEILWIVGVAPLEQARPVPGPPFF